MYTNHQCENMKGTDHSRNLNVAWMMILKYTLNVVYVVWIRQT